MFSITGTRIVITVNIKKPIMKSIGIVGVILLSLSFTGNLKAQTTDDLNALFAKKVVSLNHDAISELLKDKYLRVYTVEKVNSTYVLQFKEERNAPAKIRKEVDSGFPKK
jgi:hypothetical protein